jgi:hypothetical protein
MEPAPNPRGIAKRHKKRKLCENENPIRLDAVMKTLVDTTRPVPKRLTILSLNRPATTVPPAIIMEINPAKCKGTFKLPNIDGHVEPSNESGKPRLIKVI